MIVLFVGNASQNNLLLRDLTAESIGGHLSGSAQGTAGQPSLGCYIGGPPARLTTDLDIAGLKRLGSVVYRGVPLFTCPSTRVSSTIPELKCLRYRSTHAMVLQHTCNATAFRHTEANAARYTPRNRTCCRRRTVELPREVAGRRTGTVPGPPTTHGFWDAAPGSTRELHRTSRLSPGQTQAAVPGRCADGLSLP